MPLILGKRRSKSPSREFWNEKRELGFKDGSSEEGQGCGRRQTVRGTIVTSDGSARNGSACGGRSAWSRQGGYAPLCYENDVTPAMI